MAYVSNSMIRMERAYRESGLWGLAEEIKALDPRYAPLANISRLTTPVMTQNGMLLLAQVPRPMLMSILDNTLVEKDKAGAIKIKDWNRIPRSVKEKKEPAIYLNYYTAPDGSGLTISEYEEYLQAMEDAIQGKSTSVNGIDIVKEVNKYYRQRTNEKGAFLTDNKGPFRRDLPDLIKYQQRMIRAAKAKNCSEIRFAGEVGWAIDTDKRVKVHHKLKGSAGLFRLTMCVVSVLWPQKNFELTSFCLFRVVKWVQAEIGESIGSHLANSYAGYGGFNFTTAGISVDSALKGDARLWMDVCIQYDDVLDFANRAIVADRVKFEAKVKELEDEIERHRTIEQLEELEKEFDDLLEQADVDSLLAALQEETEKFNTVQRVVKKKEEEVKKCHDNLTILAADFQLLKIVPSEHATSHASSSSGVPLPPP